VVSPIDTDALRRLLSSGARLLEVLPRADYDEEHLPGAESLPLDELTEEAVAHLDRHAPLVVYGFDHECDRSSRAAHRLEHLGFTDVHDYVPGKVAWLGEGLPGEGRRRPEQRVSAIADPDVPRIPADATIGDAAELLAGADLGVVLTDDGVVLGLLRREVLGLDPKLLVADVLQPGPSTFRPSMTIKELIGYFRSSDENRAIVSTLGGRWIGLIRRQDVLDG
jgi:rhodanese-related sulfurtransferase